MVWSYGVADLGNPKTNGCGPWFSLDIMSLSVKSGLNHVPANKKVAVRNCSIVQIKESHAEPRTSLYG